MKSTRTQLLVTLVAMVVVAAFFLYRGLPPDREIFLAPYARDLAHLERCLDWGVSPNAWDEYGVTPLGGAAINWWEEGIETLLACGANPDGPGQLQDFRPDSPLLDAAAVGHSGIIRRLLDAGADVNLVSGGWFTLEETALDAAAAEGYLDVVELLLAHGADVRARDSVGTTCVDVATGLSSHVRDSSQKAWICTARRTPDIIRTLVRHGADVNARDQFGSTALHTAVWGGLDRAYIDDQVPQARLAVVASLILVGADKTIRDKDGRTPLDVAREMGPPAMADLLAADRAAAEKVAATPIVEPADERVLKEAQDFIDSGVDINARSRTDGRGWTALHRAADAGCAAAVRLLLEHGADVNAEDDFGSTPVIEAAKTASEDTMRALIEAGADLGPHPPGLKDRTPLNVAVERGNYWVARLIREHLAGR